MVHGAPGVYTIYNTAGNKTYNVHCHFDQKNQKSWTMVTSFAFSNNQHLSSSPFWVDKPYNEEAPNFKLYRMSLKRMMKVRKLATEWRSICAYNGKMSDRLDSVRGEFKDLDPLKNVRIGSCKRVKYVNIRGTTCIDCTAKVFQTETQFFHIDSDKTCTLPFPPDASTISEDNFGYYRNVNPNFTCTSDGESTTSWWFGN
ncbi:uncharacterized protein LOC114536587 [Dendronephthya gigantea]|uniref:uncharacterized protein LOC114536587 n=1 Tax=Dendronephthya gigantea TaxID=151771 RepID=UPI00106DBEE7|nr:uncharacterized protein LOC114536587 [Dendronephthya gigantea]